MALKINRNKFYKKNLRHKTTTLKVEDMVKSEINFCKFLKAIRSNNDDRDKPHFSAKFRKTVDNNLDRINSIINRSWYFKHAKLSLPMLASGNLTKTAIKVFTTKLAFDPFKENNKASKRLNNMRDSLNLLYAAYNKTYPSGRLYAIMQTFTITNCDKGYLDPSRHKMQHDRIITEQYLKRRLGKHYIGGICSFELTVNPDAFNNRDSKMLYHPHYHWIIITDKPLNIRKYFGHDKKVHHVCDDLVDKWIEQTHRHGNYVTSKEANDTEKVYSPGDSSADFSDGIAEATKYAIKPDIYKRLDDPYNSYQQSVFVEMINALHGFKAKVTLGLLRKTSSFLNNLGANSLMIRIAMNLNSDYNVTGEADFPEILTKVGFLKGFSYGKNAKEQSHCRISNVRNMTDEQMLYFNRGLISRSLVGTKLLNALRSYRYHSANGRKTSPYVNGIVKTINDLPYLTGVKTLSKKLQIIANNNGAMAIKHRHDANLFNKYVGKSEDLNRLVAAIRQCNDNGAIKLHQSTNPSFGFKVGNFISMYESNLKPSDRKRGWLYFACIKNGYGTSEFSVAERDKFEWSIRSAINAIGNPEFVNVPLPSNLACLDHFGCFLDNDDGNMINQFHYDKLSARVGDKDNYSDTGTKYDFNLFNDATPSSVVNMLDDAFKKLH